MIALDTNILVYAVTPDDPQSRHIQAAALLGRLGIAGGAIVPLQVIGELLNVCRRKMIVSLDSAARRADQFLNAFDCPQTQSADLTDAFALSVRHNLQYFDALILIVALRAGATRLLSEDMHDGLEIEELRVVNPFKPDNRSELDRLLG